MHDEQIPHEAIARQGPKASAIEVHCVYASPLLRDRQGEESKLPPLSLAEEFEEILNKVPELGHNRKAPT